MSTITRLAPPNAVAVLPAPPEVQGVVERVAYHDPSGPFTVAQVRPEGEARAVAVVGSYPEVRPDEVVRCVGRWVSHPRFGRQFQATAVTLVLPATAEGLRRYLASPLVEGIGPVMASRLIEHLGDDTMAALDAGAERLRAVPGIGPVRADQIARSWERHQALRAVMLTLFDFGISHRLALRVYERYGVQAPLVVRSDPYQLAIDVAGIGFKTADRIALQLGLPRDAPSRLQAGLLQCLQTAASDGHTLLTVDGLLAAAAVLLGEPAVSPLPDRPPGAAANNEPSARQVPSRGAPWALSPTLGGEELRRTVRPGSPPSLGARWQRQSGGLSRRSCEMVDGESDCTAPDSTPLLAALETLIRTGKVVAASARGEVAVALAALDRLERSVAGGLLRLAEAPIDRLARWRDLDEPAWQRAFAGLALPAPLSPEQQEAVRLALAERVCVLTGGPGTGKTTTLRALVALALGQRARVALAAPTGRAARRLAEATGVEARTIHRLLRLGFGGADVADDEQKAEALALAGLDDPGLPEHPPPRRTRTPPLQADLVVVDEASMLDVALARALVRAVPPGAHLLFVGDADQLPSVGPGQVLADVIASGRFPVARLDRIFRQGSGSGIAANAQRINAGELPVWEPGLGTEDFYLFNADDPERCRALLVDLVGKRIPQRFGLGGADVQVLAPMYRGPVGLTTLNPLLQDALNPAAHGKVEVAMGTRLLRNGDRVVQTRNNYDLGVFNGDLGVVEALDPEGYQARVRLDDGRLIVYPSRFLPELQLAYALSVHRAQGSEFAVVVLPVVTGQFILLSRRLFYTAVTRARQLVVLVGHTRAVSFAVRDAGSEARLTALAERLQEVAPSLPAPRPHRRQRQRGPRQLALL